MSNDQDGTANDSLGGASTSPIMLSPLQARLIGDQLRGIVRIATTLSGTIRQKKLPTPFHPDEVKAIGDTAERLLQDLKPLGEDGGGGK